jgi:hypothetical protein
MRQGILSGDSAQWEPANWFNSKPQIHHIMSHTVTIKAQFKDLAAIQETAREMNLAQPTIGQASLYQSKHTGVVVKLPGWTYPVIIDTQTGEAHFDNYGQRWGAQSHLDRFTQLYAVNRAQSVAKSKGLLTSRKVLPNGSIQVIATGF